MKILVGYTGFVGSNLNGATNWDLLCNSKNIEEAYNTNPDLLVYAGVPSAMFLANNHPEEDLATINAAFDNICKINPKRIVLISTIAVYPDYDNHDEDFVIDESKCSVYGKNRLLLENKVKEKFKEHTIVRLPALYGKNLKKNFIYDIICDIPKFLPIAFYEKALANTSEKNDYVPKDNKLVELSNINDITQLRKILKDNNFSTLQFTDSRSTFQFYDLRHLYGDICIALENNLKFVNLVTEGVSCNDVLKHINHSTYINETSKGPITQKLKTKYYRFFGGSNGVIADAKTSLLEISKYINKEEKSFKLSISNLGFKNEDRKDVYDYLYNLGYSGIEIAPTKWCNNEPYENIDEINNYRSEINEYGFDIVSMQSIWFGKKESLNDGDDAYNELISYTKKAVDYAKKIGCPTLVFGNPKTRCIGDYFTLEKAKGFFKEVAEYALLNNCVIALEPNPTIYGGNFCTNTLDTCKFIETVNCAGLMLNLDLGTIIENSEDLDHIFKYGKYIRHVHISEPYLEKVEFKDIHDELINKLFEINYKGYISIEMKEQPIETVKDVLLQLNNLVGDNNG